MSKEYEPQVVAELTRMAEEALPKWGLSVHSKVKLLNLSENATFWAQDDDDGHEIVIRMQRRGYSSKEAIRSELAWIEALRDSHTVNTAAPVKCSDGEYIASLKSSSEERLAVAFEKLEGHEPDLSQNDLPHWFEVLGRITAKLHAHAKEWQYPEWFSRRRWDYEGIIGTNAYWGSWRDAQGMDEKTAKIFAAVLEEVKPKVLAFGTTADRFGVIHGDLRATNLLVDGDKLQLLDFDDMGFGYFLFDFGAALSFMEQSKEAPALASSWVRGYESIRTLSAEEKTMLPVFSILRRLELCAWCGSHSEVPFAKEQGVQITKDSVRLCESFLDGTYLKEEESKDVCVA